MAEWPKNIVLRDVREPLPFADDSVDFIYSSHMLEHLPLADAERVLRDCRRVLSAGGVIRLALPDGLRFARELVDAGGSAEAARKFSRDLNAHPLEPAPLYRRIFRWGHQWQPTAALAVDMLKSAGFVDVDEKEFRVGELPDLETLEHRAEGIFVEARG